MNMSLIFSKTFPIGIEYSGALHLAKQQVAILLQIFRSSAAG
jgi:hypothetical protein